MLLTFSSSDDGHGLLTPKLLDILFTVTVYQLSSVDLVLPLILIRIDEFVQLNLLSMG